MAIITPNMALTAWNSSTDPYNHDQLAANFVTLDQHDHSPGNGVQINGATGIKDASIPFSKLSSFVYKEKSIPGYALQDNTVTPDKTSIIPYCYIKLQSGQNIGITNTTGSATPIRFTDTTGTRFQVFNNSSFPNMALNTGIIIVPQSGIYSISASFLLRTNQNQDPGTNQSLSGVIRVTDVASIATSTDADNIAVATSGFEYTGDDYPVNASGIRYLSQGQAISFWYTCKLTNAGTYSADNILFTAAYLGRYVP